MLSATSRQRGLNIGCATSAPLATSALNATSSPSSFFLLFYRRSAPRPPPPPPPPPTPPKPPRKPVSFTVHGVTWEDSYSWMADLSDATAMRHMDMCMEQEEKYAEAAMAAASADRLQRKLQLEMASRMASDPCSPLVKWGPWLYYLRIEEGKQYPVLCRRSVKLHEEFVSFSEPSTGFDFMSGRRIEEKILDYNQEADLSVSGFDFGK